MDYEKKYKEALERARELQHDNCWVTNIFPELKESEDEKIRKELIEYLRFKYEDPNAIRHDYEKWISWLEKQVEQKPINDTDEEIVKAVKDTSILVMVEPRFKVGQWIIDIQDSEILHINKVLKYAYEVTNLKGDSYEASRCSIETWYKCWTIKDAKDGDVLVTVGNERPFIYKGCLDPNHPDLPVAYCGMDIVGCFCKGRDEEDKFDHWWTNAKVQPATKEQREFLFSKMEEAGYKWDDERKKLGKRMTDEGKSEIFTKTMNDEKVSPIWSEEDELHLKDALFAAAKLYSPDCGGDELVDWLKSLKDRMKGE